MHEFTFGTYDLETYGLGGDVAGIGAYDGKAFHTFPDAEELLTFFEQSPIDVWYAHNGGRYDLKYLFSTLLEWGCYLDITDMVGSWSCVKVYEGRRTRKRIDKYGKQKTSVTFENMLFELRDSLQLLPSGQKDLSKAFHVLHEKQEYDDYEKHHDRQKMLEYLEYDCIGLHEILSTFREEMGVNELPLTTAGMAMHVFRERFGGNDYLDMCGRKQDRFRLGYSGGRTEVFKRYGEQLYYYDVNSLYPSVMLSEIYPYGPVCGTFDFIPDRCGYYYVRVKTPEYMHIPFLPKKEKNKLLFPLGEWEGWYYSPEIFKAMSLGYEFELIKGWYWEEYARPFEDYIKYFYHIKETHEGAKRFIAKLMLNALYGKFAQKTERIKKYDLRDMDGDEVVEKQIIPYPQNMEFGYAPVSCGYSKFIRPQISGFITSYGRCLLYEYMEKVGTNNVYYCDTDSIVTDVQLDDKYIGTDIGQMKLEAELLQGIFLLPKVYAIKNKNYETIIRAKGMQADYLSYNDYMHALKGNWDYMKCLVRKMVGFNEKLRRGIEGEYWIVQELEKQLSGDFTKRILMEDGIHTQPIII